MAGTKKCKMSSFLYTLKCILTAMVVVAVLSGCVERQLTINTEPQGALVVLNDEEIGISPVTIEFNWYGDYKVRITKQGYETLDTHRKLDPPPHDSFPLDFFAEVLWPKRIVDKYEWSFKLQSYQPMARDDLLKAAQVMKQKTLIEMQKAETEIAQEKKNRQK